VLQLAGNIQELVTNFYGLLIADQNHRYKSWEHCYAYFSKNDASESIDISCLHLSFYLASWGMYRGSSFLLWKDYQIHTEIVKKILENKHLQRIDFASVEHEKLKEIITLIEWIKNWYTENIKIVNGEQKTINVTDTLVTKILLGTLGCVPAYDRYFIDGMRKSGIRYSILTEGNLESVVDYYKKNQREFDGAQQAIYEKSKILYPPMKLVDMYFWEIGFQADKKKQRAIGLTLALGHKRNMATGDKRF